MGGASSIEFPFPLHRPMAALAHRAIFEGFRREDLSDSKKVRQALNELNQRELAIAPIKLKSFSQEDLDHNGNKIYQEQKNNVNRLVKLFNIASQRASIKGVDKEKLDAFEKNDGIFVGQAGELYFYLKKEAVNIDDSYREILASRRPIEYADQADIRIIFSPKTYDLFNNEEVWNAEEPSYFIYKLQDGGEVIVNLSKPNPERRVVFQYTQSGIHCYASGKSITGKQDSCFINPAKEAA